MELVVDLRHPLALVRRVAFTRLGGRQSLALLLRGGVGLRPALQVGVACEPPHGAEKKIQTRGGKWCVDTLFEFICSPGCFRNVRSVFPEVYGFCEVTKKSWLKKYIFAFFWLKT